MVIFLSTLEIFLSKTCSCNKSDSMGMIGLKVMRRWKCGSVYMYMLKVLSESHTNCNILLIIQVFVAL